jgi:hypothetical protein
MVKAMKMENQKELLDKLQKLTDVLTENVQDHIKVWDKLEKIIDILAHKIAPIDRSMKSEQEVNLKEKFELKKKTTIPDYDLKVDDFNKKLEEVKRLGDEIGITRLVVQTRTERDQRAELQLLTDFLIPCLNEAQREICSDEFSWGVSHLKEDKPTSVHVRVGGELIRISVEPEGIKFKKNDNPEEDFMKQIGQTWTRENVRAWIGKLIDEASFGQF